MGKFYDQIPERLIEWIGKQEVFWVATAPLAKDGHVNVSPKGLRGCFHVESPTRVWYEDLSGSGCETIAHVRENGRITFLFNAFEGRPQIARLFGTGTIYEFETQEYESYIPLPERRPGSRAVIVADIHKVGTSCGWGVPYYKFEGQRRLLSDFSKSLEKRDTKFEAEPHVAGAMAERGLKRWWALQNTASIDRLPALSTAPLSTLPLTSRPLDVAKAGLRVRVEIKGEDASGMGQTHPAWSWDWGGSSAAV